MEIYVPDKWFQEISIQPGYYEKEQNKKPDNTWKDYYYAQALRFQKSLPYKEEVVYLFIVDQCCKEDMDSEVISKVLLAVIGRNWKICLELPDGNGIATCVKVREY